MVTWNEFDLNAYRARLGASNERLDILVAARDERKLHEEIIAFCNSQWPKWKFIHARMDKRSTIEEGAQDFTIFLPNGRTLCVECKAKNRKLSPDQLAWKLEMERLYHEVHTVRSMEEFHRIANLVTKPPHDNAADSGVPKLHHVRD